MDSETAVALLLSVFAIALVGVLATALPLDGATSGGPVDGADPSGPDPAVGGESALPDPPPMHTLVALGLLLCVVGAVAYRLRNAAPGGDPGRTTEAARPPDLTGTAAPDPGGTRIRQDRRAENDVYGAWADLARTVRVPNGRSATPADFEARAIAVGLPADAVTELTRLFRDVRYGHREPTPSVEQRARAAARRIDAAADGEAS